VATGRFVYDPAAYPLVHFINSDDPVPRMGALLHLGLCVEYQPDDAFRAEIYRLSTQEEDVQTRESFRFLTDGMQDMPSSLLHMAAMLEVLAEEKGAEGMNELISSWWAVPAVDKVLWRAGDRAMDLLDALLTSAREAYLALMGRAMDERALTALRQRIRPLVQNTPVRRLMEVLSDLGVAPHRLAGPYAAIVMNALDELRPFIWIKVSAGLPVRRYGSWLEAGAWPELATPVFARAKRQKAIPYAINGKLRLSYSARRRNPD